MVRSMHEEGYMYEVVTSLRSIRMISCGFDYLEEVSSDQN
jgi:hypothetical protein